jgi:hypothetical protein
LAGYPGWTTAVNTAYDTVEHSKPFGEADPRRVLARFLCVIGALLATPAETVQDLFREGGQGTLIDCFDCSDPQARRHFASKVRSCRNHTKK